MIFIIIVTIMSFLIVSAGLMLVYMVLESRYRRFVLVRRFSRGSSAAGQRLLGRGAAAWQRMVHRAGVIVAPRKSDDRADIRTLLTRAGYRSEKALAYFFGIRFCLAAVLGLLYLPLALAGGGFAFRPLIFTFFPLAFGYYLPHLVLKNRVARRRQQIFRELPDTLDLLLICMEAGLSFDMALQRISRELVDMAPVLSAEFGQYYLEIQGGLPRRRVLHNLAQRNDTPALTAVVNVLLQSVRFGTDVAEALRIHIQSMRTERRQTAEEKGAKISNHLTLPLVVLILPALLIIILGPAIINIMGRLQGGF